MDPMRALASLEFVSARGLDTSDQGPTILANQVFCADFLMIILIISVWEADDEAGQEEKRVCVGIREAASQKEGGLDHHRHCHDNDDHHQHQHHDVMMIILTW